MAKKNETVMMEASKCKCCICGKHAYAKNNGCKAYYKLLIIIL